MIINIKKIPSGVYFSFENTKDLYNKNNIIMYNTGKKHYFLHSISLERVNREQIKIAFSIIGISNNAKYDSEHFLNRCCGSLESEYNYIRGKLTNKIIEVNSKESDVFKKYYQNKKNDNDGISLLQCFLKEIEVWKHNKQEFEQILQSYAIYFTDNKNNSVDISSSFNNNSAGGFWDINGNGTLIINKNENSYYNIKSSENTKKDKKPLLLRNRLITKKIIYINPSKYFISPIKNK